MNDFDWTIIMPTYNSEKTIEKSLLSVRQQVYQQELIEILVIDGGSTDATLDIANKYGATILKNPKRLPEYAKKIGFSSAKGKYIMFLDSDEVLVNQHCLNTRIDFFKKHKNVKNITSTGGPAPIGYKASARYANRIGDPFSNFCYDHYNGFNYLKTMKKQFPYTECDGGFIFYYDNARFFPLFDGLGNSFEKEYAMNLCLNDSQKDVTTDIFYNISSTTNTSAILNNDFVLHYQKASFRGFIKKIQWRIINNLFNDNCVGYSTRATKQKYIANRKYLFIPYCIFIIPVLIRSVYLAIQEKDIGMLLHFVFTELTFLLICWYMLKKILHIPQKRLISYGK